jgi:hypothetical protein
MFNEENTVESFVRDLLCGVQPLARRVVAQRNRVFVKNPVSMKTVLETRFLRKTWFLVCGVSHALS